MECQVTAIDGKIIDLPVQNYSVPLCCHSDSPSCLEIVRAARQAADEFNEKHGY